MFKNINLNLNIYFTNSIMPVERHIRITLHEVTVYTYCIICANRDIYNIDFKDQKLASKIVIIVDVLECP